MTDGRTHHAECFRQHIDCAARRIAELERLLRDVRDDSALEFTDPRIRYATVQMGRDTWFNLAALRLSTDCDWTGLKGESCQAEREEGRELCKRHRVAVELLQEPLRDADGNAVANPAPKLP